jgi:release factor glutamine methyltransferase
VPAIEDLDRTTDALRLAGCVAAEEEAVELLEAAGNDTTLLESLVTRRCSGEPLAWLTGSVRFCGERVLVHGGVFVPRWQSEPLALAALDRLPGAGVAVELCCGAAAIATVLRHHRPRARVLGCDIDPLAVTNARANGIEAFLGDLTAPLPSSLSGRVDVVVAVVPYVPTGELVHLPRDVLEHEPLRSLDGGVDGLELLRRAALETVGLLRPGGSLLLELGGDEAALLEPLLADNGYRDFEVMCDEDGDTRAVCCRR